MPTAREGIEFLKARLDSEHQPADLPDLLGSAGFAIVFGPTDFVVVSVEPDAPEHVAITCGILKDVTSDRSRLLECCNTDTANNPGMPIFSHGRDVLLQMRIPIALVARIPEMLLGSDQRCSALCSREAGILAARRDLRRAVRLGRGRPGAPVPNRDHGGRLARQLSAPTTAGCANGPPPITSSWPTPRTTPPGSTGARRNSEH